VTFYSHNRDRIVPPQYSSYRTDSPTGRISRGSPFVRLIQALTPQGRGVLIFCGTPTPTPGRNVCVLKDDFRENLNVSNKRCTIVYNGVQAKF